MLPSDETYFGTLIDQLTTDLRKPEHQRTYTQAAVPQIIEGRREELTALLGFNRITQEEYEELDGIFARLAEQFSPLHQWE